MSVLGFIARMDPLSCMQWIPQIHLWCDTCWPLARQPNLFDPYTYTRENKHRWDSNLESSVRHSVYKMWYYKRLGVGPHHYNLGLIPTRGHMWDVFYPSQPMPGGFPLWIFSTLRRARNCYDWNCLIRLTGLTRTCSGWRKINGFSFYYTYWFWDICG